MNGNENGRSREFLVHEQTELEKKKGRIAGWLAVAVLLSAVLIGIGFLTGNTALVIGLGIINILFGPVTLFFYLREVKRGIFRADVEADMQEEGS
ncbi:MAG: hypothetical protein LBD12_04445 [Clostridiales Family XIII bacterium]|nr:hypothetical protein [Clostridiales Family XIII bacterium]